ncbi:hypothetical protein I4U23_027511 [Adineta vaga]|nr:hypothetical protein I4U23_027511 [Adineta vaga]
MNTKILLNLFLCYCSIVNISISKNVEKRIRFQPEYYKIDNFHMETTEQTSTKSETIVFDNLETSTISIMNNDTDIFASTQSMLDDRVEIRIEVDPMVLRVRHGQTVDLTCTAYGANSETSVYWIQKTPKYRNASIDDTIKLITISQITLISRITLDDPSKIGEYICVAEDYMYLYESAIVLLYEESDYISQTDDSHTDNLELTSNHSHTYLHIVTTHMIDGDFVEIQCQGAAQEDYEHIQWYFNNSQIIQDQQPFYPRGNILHIRPISISYLGNYRCTIPKNIYMDGNCIFTFENTNTNKFLSSNCECCSSSSQCRNQTLRCSTNIDCECLTMTMSGSSICADTIISCRNLHLCQNDNLRCSTPNTVCVNNTRCNVPVCFPIERTSSHLCPPLTSRTSIINKSISGTACNPACINSQMCVNGFCASTENFVISATWSTAGDGDLIVTTPNDKDIHLANNNATFATDYGSINYDDKTGTGPEIVFWTENSEPPHGTYHICFQQHNLNATIENPIITVIGMRKRFGVINTFIKIFTTRIVPFLYTCAPHLDTYVVSVTYP